MATVTLTNCATSFLGPENPAFHFDEDSRKRALQGFKNHETSFDKRGLTGTRA